MTEAKKFQPLYPFDEFNRTLELNAHPADWQNPTPKQTYHLVVIGAGTAGLVSAAVAAGLGARVALIERELMGGDCLNVGCVPSKAIIVASKLAADLRQERLKSMGFDLNVGASIQFAEVMRRMRKLRAQISPLDSAKRFKDLGVDVFFGQAAFVDRSTIQVIQQNGSHAELKFKKAVIATGARPAIPAVAGIDSINYLTNESLFSVTELPARLGVLGAGPVGIEMAQAFARLGSKVVLLNRTDQILGREDPDAVEIVQTQLARDGIEMILGYDNLKLASANHQIQVTLSRQNQTREIEVDHLLVATGRSPRTSGLNLESGGVEYDDNGVKVMTFCKPPTRMSMLRATFVRRSSSLMRLIFRLGWLFKMPCSRSAR